jgi:hypothetical protein
MIIMAESLKPPKNFDFNTRNLPVAWEMWREEWELYSDLALDGKDDPYKKKLFLYCIGDKGREIHKTLTIEADTIAGYIAAFKAYCVPKANVTLERYKFFSRNQMSGETFEEYLAALRTLSLTCDFGNLKDSLIKDRVVCGISRPQVRERLLRTDDLTLDKCITLCKASEVTQAAVKTLGPDSESVSVLHKSTRRPVSTSSRKGPASVQTAQPTPKSDGKEFMQCKFCGRRHKFGANLCPAWGKTCTKCGRKNHFAAKCETKQASRSVRMVEQEEEELPFVLSVEKTPEGKEFATMKIISTGKYVKFQLDSGSTCNIVPLLYLSAEQKIAVDRSRSTSLHLYDSDVSVKTLGELVVPMINPKTNQGYRVVCQVVENDNRVPILGNRAAQSMGLITVNRENILTLSTKPQHQPLTSEAVLSEFSDVFSGTGLLSGEYHIELDKSVKPVIHPPRRVPVAVKDKLKAELDKLEEEGIIVKETEPTERLMAN